MGNCELRGMARRPRKDGRGAVQHVFIRGARGSLIAIDAVDYEHGLFLLERTVVRFDLVCHGWAYLSNHSHLLVTSQEGNLSTAMQWHGTCAAQFFNQRHESSGHVYQGRFGSRMVETDGHLLELARYLPLNPVNAGLCDSPEDWQWSSYAATIGARTAPWFLNAGAFLDAFRSVDAYADWVAQGVDPARLDQDGAPVPPPPPIPLAALLLDDDSDKGLALAHFDHGFSQSAIARQLGISASQVCRRIARAGKGTT
jgi:putative transposase